MLDAIWMIDVQNVNRRSSLRRIAHQERAIPVKMLIPDVVARMKETRDCPGGRVDARDIGSLVGIAVETTRCQIVGRCLSAVLLRDNVVDLRRKAVRMNW